MQEWMGILFLVLTYVLEKGRNYLRYVLKLITAIIVHAVYLKNYLKSDFFID